MHTPGKLKVADGRVREVAEETLPVLSISLHTSWGLVSLDPSFAAMPGGDDAIILGNQRDLLSVSRGRRNELPFEDFSPLSAGLWKKEERPCSCCTD